MKTALLALVVVGCSSPPAKAPFTPIPPEPEDAADPCGTTTDPVLEVVHRDDRTPAHPTSRLVIGPGGSWRSEHFFDGKALNQDGGCLAASDLASLKAALRDARWTITTGSFCEATSQYSTDFVIGGRVVYTQRTCDGQILDEASQHAWLEIRRIEGVVSPKHY